MSSEKLQSAIEYLLSYGWAILIFALVIAYLTYSGYFSTYLVSPKVSPGSCQVYRANGPTSTAVISLRGACNNELPQYVAELNQPTPSNSFINVGTTGLPLGGQARSVFAWVYFTGSSANSTIFSYGTNAANELTDFAIVSTVSGNNLYFSSNSNNAKSSLAIIPNAWNFVGYSYILNSSQITFWADGMSNTAILSGPAPLNTVLPATDAADIGKVSNGGANYFSGSIANLQVYSIPFTVNDTTTLYEEGIGGPPIALPWLVAWWVLNGNANDYSGNLNNGVSNSITFSSSWYNTYAGALSVNYQSPPTNTIYALEMLASPVTGGATSPSSGTYPSGAVVTISETSNTGFTFTSWSCTGMGCYSGSSPSANIVISGLTKEIANFQGLPYTLTTAANPPADGSVSPPTGNFLGGNTVTITATPNFGYNFGSWSCSGTGCYSGTNAVANIVISGVMSETANFNANAYTLTTAGSPSGSGTASPSSGSYLYGNTVTISETPTGSNVFSSWSCTGTGCYSGSNTVANIVISGAMSETANFNPASYTLTTSSNPSAGGSVSPPTGSYLTGNTVTITATANAGYYFAGWSCSGTGCYSGSSSSNTITITSTTTETANFNQLLECINFVTSSASNTVTSGEGVGAISYTMYGGGGGGGYYGINNGAGANGVKQTGSFSISSGNTLAIYVGGGGGAGTGGGGGGGSGWYGGGGGYAGSVTGCGIGAGGGGGSSAILTNNVLVQYAAGGNGGADVDNAGAGSGGTNSGGAAGSDGGSCSSYINSNPSSGGQGFGGNGGNGNPSYQGGPGGGGGSGGTGGSGSSSQWYPGGGGGGYGAGGGAADNNNQPSGAGGSNGGNGHPNWGGGGYGIGGDSGTGSPGYTNGGSGGSITLTYNAISCIGLGTTEYPVTISASPSAGGNVLPSSGNYVAGNTVQISETPNSGYVFTGWTGSGTGNYTGTNAIANIIVNSEITEVANYNPSVSLDNYVSFGGGSSNTISTSIANEMILVAADGWSSGGPSSVSVDGNSATEIALEHSGNTGVASMWYYLAPSSGSHSISVSEGSLSGTFYENFAASFKGIVSAGMTYNDISSTSDPQSLVLTPSANSLLFATNDFQCSSGSASTSWSTSSGTINSLSQLTLLSCISSSDAYQIIGSSGTYTITANDVDFNSAGGDLVVAQFT